VSAAGTLAGRLRRLAGRLGTQAGPDSGPQVPGAAAGGGIRPGLARRAGFALALALFSLGLALVMLDAKFPDERLRLWIERSLSPGRGVTLSVREVRTTLFPPGAVLSGLRLRLEGASEPLADMPEAVLRLDLAAACLGRLEVSARGAALGGGITLAAASDGLFGGGWRRVEMTASGLDLGRSPGLAWLLNRHAGGRLSGQLDFAPGRAGSARLGVLLEDAFLEVEGEMLRAVRVELGRMAVRAVAADGGLEVSECSVASDMLRGNLTGRIVAADDIRASRLDFTGALTDQVQAEVTAPKPAGLRLTGTLANPAISWDRPGEAVPPPGPGPGQP
jgi:hypothetical protein